MVQARYKELKSRCVKSHFTGTHHPDGNDNDRKDQVDRRLENIAVVEYFSG